MTGPLQIQIVSTDPTTDPRCGIASHTRFLVDHGTPYGLQFTVDGKGLNPQACTPVEGCRVLHLNYHRGLHSRWTPEILCNWRQAFTDPAVVITFHDTYAAPQPDGLAAELAGVADAFIIHEPAKDLLSLGSHVYYWRQGVPQWSSPNMELSAPAGFPPLVLGTIGHDFPWKQYDLLAEATAAAGWGLLIVGGIAPYRCEALERLNPATWILDLPHPGDALSALRQYCAATAFLYQCANSGTSAAIRYGLAAGKPLFATDGCRQFRDLQAKVGAHCIRWLGEGARDARAFADILANGLTQTGPQTYDPRIVALAWNDRWDLAAGQYADLYYRLAIYGERRRRI